MSRLRRLKLKTKLQTNLAKLIYVFNRKVKGVKACYNVPYASDGSAFHKCDVFKPTSAENLPVVLYFHGGGWTAYDKSLFRSSCKRIAERGAVVYNCNYSLSPKYSIEDMEKDVLSAIEYARASAKEFGGNQNKIILAGDSAGAHLAALVTNKLAADAYGGNESPYPFLCGVMLFYGVYDLTALFGTGFKNVDTYLSAVVPKTHPRYADRLKELSPVNYLRKGLPPAFVCSGMVDKLHGLQSAVYAEKLRSFGVSVTEFFFDEREKKANHKFFTFDFNRAAKKAFEGVAEFLETAKEYNFSCIPGAAADALKTLVSKNENINGKISFS